VGHRSEGRLDIWIDSIFIVYFPYLLCDDIPCSWLAVASNALSMYLGDEKDVVTITCMSRLLGGQSRIPMAV